ncbi:heavy metal translocating P-type ATPase [Psychromonas sp. CD1]|uniref:heavy metal translocating P-type ATPase n=1 Tax=Psychromonas sp. CD1 TaxID=1979839 RepID=UPI000B9C0C3C|nr:heavy metal translocating P-type ATPase [Psychromonas sp. CD1]
MTQTAQCFHCGEPNPAHTHYQVKINGNNQDLCCPGCQAVAQMIVDNGASSYYQHRSAPANKVEMLLPEELQQLEYYDVDKIQEDYLKKGTQFNEITLSVEGVTCAACAWLIEKQLRRIPGLLFINVNTTLQRIALRWDNKKVKLSQLLKAIQAIGYKAYPFQIDQEELFYKQQTQAYLRRLGLAGLASMQILMFAIALYGDFFSSMEIQFVQYFRWVSFILATPVLLYSAQPFYLNAWRDIKHRTLGMDIPISIALLSAYVASAYATIFAQGDVYFESVSMFTFLLLLGRSLELRARRKASEISNNLLRLLPIMATLLDGEKQILIPAKMLKVGQIFLVKAGERIATDGCIISGASSIEESMLTGESAPIRKKNNSYVYAATVNISSPLTIRVEKTTQDSLINDIIHLQNDAQMHKPHIEILATQVSRYFVGALLIIALLTYISWLFIDADKAFWITLSVLVATCPCALSLATPTALTCATANLNKQGILIKKHHVLETLSAIKHIIFDKTGTLTKGNFKVLQCTTYANAYSKQQCLDISAQIESLSEHPIAQAFHCLQVEKINLNEIQNKPGQGIQARYQNKTLKLGHALFCQIEPPIKSSNLLIYLTLNNQLLAIFELGDELRSSAKKILQYCTQNNIKSTLLSGDISMRSDALVQQLNIDILCKGISPKGKLAYIQKIQRHELVLMVGDGINDAPVLAGAHVSIALSSGTDIAKNSADVILLGSDLSKIIILKDTAQKTVRIIKQNLAWAMLYNLIIVPLAVSGHVLPYIAVLGMSCSSLIVLSNSLRLLKEKH